MLRNLGGKGVSQETPFFCLYRWMLPDLWTGACKKPLNTPSHSPFIFIFAYLYP